MSGSTSTVGAVSTQIRGVTYKKAQAQADPAPGYVPVIGASQIRPEGIDISGALHVPQFLVADQQILRDGDIVVATSSGSLSVVGKAARVSNLGHPHTFGAFCKVLRPDQNRVDPRYLAHSFRTVDYRARISAVAAGANINNLRGEHLAKLPLPLPPIDEQRRIADVLDRADALRAKRRETLARLDELTQSIFANMFASADIWPRRPLGELLSNIDSGKSPTCHDRPAGDSELGVLKLGAVSFGQYRAAENKAVLSNSDVRQVHEVTAGDVLLSRKNTTELVGASVLIEETRPGLHLPDLIFRLVPDPASGIRPRYLRDALATPASRQTIRALAGGSAASMVNISKAKLRTVAIAVPDDATQARYIARIEHVRACQRAAGRELALLDELFASLQQRAFRGDLFSSPLPPELTDAVA